MGRSTPFDIAEGKGATLRDSGQTCKMIAGNLITVKVKYLSTIIRMGCEEVEKIEGVGENFVVW